MTTRMDMLVTARNQASGTLKEVKGDLGELNNVAKTLNAGMLGVAAFMGVDAIAQLGKAVFDLGKEAQGVGNLKTSFDDLAQSIGSTGPAMLDALRGVSQGMVADQDLIMSANRAIVLGVASNTQEMEQLMQVAIARGRAMGLSATQAFNDLVTGLGRMSPLILDNLGIVTGGEKVFKDYAASIGVAAESLSDAEKKQALFNKVIGESQGMLAKGIQANPFAQMEASMANMRLRFGELVAPLAGGMASALNDAISQISTSLNNADQAGFSSVGEKWGYAIGEAMATSIAKILHDRRGNILEQLVDTQMQVMVDLAVAADAMQKGMNEGMKGDANTQRMDDMRELAELQKKLAETQRDINEAMKDAVAFENQTPPNTQMAQQSILAAQKLAEEYGKTKARVYELEAAVGGLQGPMTQATAAILGSAGAAQQAWTGWKDFGAATTGAAGAQRAAAGPIANVTELLKAQASAAASATAQLKSMYIAQAGALGAAQAFQSFQNRDSELKAMRDIWQRQGVPAGEQEFREAAWIQQQNQKLQWDLDAPRRAQEAQAKLTASYKEGNEAMRSGEREVQSWGQRVQEEFGWGLSRADLMKKRLDDIGASYAASFGGGGGGGGMDAAAQMLDDLRGRVQGVLGNALNVDVGVSPDQFLPREDAINEDARRLADVMVKGFESPWYEYLNSKFPGMFEGAGGDVQGRAAQIMRDFQAGLVPELVDKEKVKDQVKRMILGEQSMSALADEIAQELSQELGMSLAKAKESVGAVMGLQQGEGGGAGSTVADGFAQGTDGESMVGGIVERMEAAYTKLQQSGVKAGQMWGAGFMGVVETGVSVPLIQLLAVLVTPNVLKAIQDNKSKSGAE